jgi:hypothetical protein
VNERTGPWSSPAGILRLANSHNPLWFDGHPHPAGGRARDRAIRAELLPTIKRGLRALYRTLELPGQNPLKDAHAALDTAVLDAYGFSPTKDLLKQLLDLNLAVAKAIDKGEPVTAPGVPPSYGDPADLITDDCIRP